MTDPEYVAKEHEAQQARFEEFVKNPQAHGTPPPPPPSPPRTRRVSFIGRNHEDSTELDLRTRLGPNVGYYPGGNDADEVLSLQDTPKYLLSEGQRATMELLMPPPPPPQQVQGPLPTHGLRTYTTAARIVPPGFLQPFAMPPAYTMVRTPGPDYGKHKVVRPPANVQPPLNIELGMVEICTFMPDWLMIPEVMSRMMQNRADASILGKIELKAINQLTAVNLAKRCDILNKQMSIYGKALFRVPQGQEWDIAYAQSAGPQNDLTANTWRNPTDQPFGAWKLDEIFSKVPRENWPKGDDLGLFTQCLEYAAMFPRKELWSAHVAGLVKVLQLQPAAAPATGNRDQLVVSRFSIPDPSE